MNRTKTCLLAALSACLIAVSFNASAKNQKEEVNEDWQSAILAAIDSFPEHGGYYTGSKPNELFAKTTWRGLHDAFQMQLPDSRPVINVQKAQPSFCSSATYLALIKGLLIWDKKHVISRTAWIFMKPYVGIVDNININGFGQSDGEGFWGRCNANGPSIGVLVKELKAGFSYTAFRGAKSEKNKEKPDEKYMTDEEWRADPIWSHAVKGDIMKIFWNRNETKGRDSGAIIGDNGVKEDDQEAGHSVIFMGYSDDGKVLYWSSNGPGEHPEQMGYSIGSCDKTDIQRIVITRITKPENFDKVKNMKPIDANQYLFDLNGKKHSTTAELKKHCGIK